MHQPTSAPDVVPPPEPPRPGPDVVPPPERPPAEPDADGEGTNATIHHPDDQASHHPANPDHKTRGPYVTGNS